MPSIEAPTYYDRTKGILPGRYDSFFKWVNAYMDCADHETGEVDSPLGFVALVEVDETMQNDFMHEENLPDDLCHECRNNHGVPDTGWYVTRLDSNGIIFAMEYGEGTLAEESARADFAEAEKVAEAWSRACDGDYS
jgi:hypothetical protein